MKEGLRVFVGLFCKKCDVIIFIEVFKTEKYEEN
tara:strand:+ start:181 stop:282 length:102 start_codon:yes stop_codon:yes gene_type:complete